MNQNTALIAFVGVAGLLMTGAVIFSGVLGIQPAAVQWCEATAGLIVGGAIGALWPKSGA